jgi:hypothetical protein
MIAPVRVDTVTFDEATDFDGFVHGVLDGGGGIGSFRDDNAPLDGIVRIYEALRSTLYADRLTRGVAACLTAARPEVRSQALVFFQSRPRVAGGDRIDELVAGGRAQFAGVADPLHPGVDLEWQLLAVLGVRVSCGSARSLELARGEALVPGRAQPFIGALTSTAPDWVIEHAEDIVRATPEAGLTILVGLQEQRGNLREQRGDLRELGRRIAPLCRGDASFETDVSRYVDDPGLRQVLLDAFQARPSGR